jgi:phosphoribosylamine-glycine ligase
VNEVVVHGIPSKRKVLKEGDIITLDFGVNYKGYHADSATTYPVGTIKPEIKKLLEITEKSACTVMLVSGGYPEAYQKGKEISFKKDISDSIVFHAGTALKEDKVVTNGGRVVAVSSFGSTKKEALDKSYASLKKISFENMYFRSDIGFDL